MKARLILEDGTVFNGKAFGYLEESVGEVVFNTSMTGYGEVLTDPSYYGQIDLPINRELWNQLRRCTIKKCMRQRIHR